MWRPGRRGLTDTLILHWNGRRWSANVDE